jgi:catalase
MVLDRNPANFFAQIEQAAFEPSNMVPGIGPSPDKMLLGRLFSYADTHRYRIGTNYKQLPVNAPQVEVHSYSKDGSMRYRYNDAQPVYAPNSYGGPQADPQRYPEPSWFASGEIMRSAYTPHAEDNDFVQAGNLYRNAMSATDREHLVNNIVGHMSQGVERFIQERTVKSYWYLVDPDLGARVARGLGLEIAPELTTSAGGE